MITITAETKESMSKAVRRAMGNADTNNKNVILSFKGIDVEVIPYDKPNRIFKHLTVQTLVNKIRKLESTLVPA